MVVFYILYFVQELAGPLLSLVSLSHLSLLFRDGGVAGHLLGERECWYFLFSIFFYLELVQELAGPLLSLGVAGHLLGSRHNARY